MGYMLNGQWVDEGTPLDTNVDKKGAFNRHDSVFRSYITADEPNGLTPDSGRYHLYVSYACPWAHRCQIMRKLKGLEEVISLSIVNPLMGNKGWPFGGYEGADEDPIFGAKHLHEVYSKAKSDYSGRVVVPVLFDKQNGTIVSNESSEIIRMFNHEFPQATGHDYYPEELRPAVDEINEKVYHNINNGVYKCGFARTQEAYDEAVTALFENLEMVEGILANSRYLVGNVITLADIRLFTTLIRFDPVYYTHFKTNIKRISDYPNLYNYTKDIYQVPGIAELCNMDHIKTHYYWSQTSCNPQRIVAAGPSNFVDYNEPHDRDRFS